MADHEDMVRALSEGFSERDLSGAREWLHDDVIFDWSHSMSDNRGVHQGYDSVQKLFEDFFEAWDTVNWRVVDAERLGPDRLLVGTRLDARGRGSGIDVSGSGAQIWDLRDGKLARVTLFQDRQSAEAALAAGELD